MRILIVEDDADIAESLSAVLETEGYDTTVTANGLEAVQLAARQPFDLLLLDVQVWDLSGLGVERAVSDLRSVPTIVMSAGGGAWKQEAFAGGAIACLSKPFAITDLLRLLESLLASDTSRRGLPGDVRSLGQEDLDRLRSMSTAELDALPFGVIALDRDRRIVQYNSFESRNAHLEREQVVGRSFSDIAPCSLVRDFGAALEEGFARRHIDRVLRFIFPHHRGRAVVSVRFYFDETHERMWLFVSKRPGELLPEAGVEEAVLEESLGEAPAAGWS